MKNVIGWVALMSLMTFGATAGESLRQIDWADAALSAGEAVLVPGDDGQVNGVRIGNPGSGPLTVRLHTFEQPGIASDRFAVKGQVRYQDVEGTAYLELLTEFPDGQTYFSRTLGQTPLDRPLTGSSDWRPFALPFYILDSAERPVKLAFNLVLPAGGSVELGSVALYQYAGFEDPMDLPGQWWSERLAGVAGGVLGGVLGVLGGLSGWLVAKGRGRGLVLGILRGLIGVGVVALVAGGFAVWSGQPYAVYFPLLLLGALCVLIPGFNLRMVEQRYRQMELRRMEARDTGA